MESRRFKSKVRKNNQFDSDSGHFSRSTPLSYTYADFVFAAIWNTILLFTAPSVLVFLPAAVTGIAAVLVDYVWFYRNGHREVILDDKAAEPNFVAWWLVFWFDFLIAWNIGSFVGLALLFGLTTLPGLAAAFAFCAWFWVATPALSRALLDNQIGTQVILTTRRVGQSLSYARFAWVSVLYAALLASVLNWNFAKATELFAIGMIAAGAMELPLYLLRIRTGRDAWKALVVNTLVEWNYAVPIFYLVFYLLGKAG